MASLHQYKEGGKEFFLAQAALTGWKFFGGHQAP